MVATIALAGNPNTGKSTIFNGLTGSHQHVGNWPGKTVEKKEGRLRVGEREILVVDLPGTYSLTAYSIEEIIARDFIINEHPTAVVAVVDASNLERNLYLVAQLIEHDLPVIVALNMTDVATSRGLRIDAARLSERLGGVPVVETVGNRSLGLDQLRRAMADVVDESPQARHRPRYSGPLEVELQALEAQVARHAELSGRYQPRWLATKLLEGDPAVAGIIETAGGTALLAAASEAQRRIEAETGEDAETLIASQRYAFVGDIIDSVLVRPSQAVLTWSDRIDRVVTHRAWGLPIFLAMMWLVFQFTANVSAPYLDWIDVFVNDTVYGWAGALMAALGLEGSWLSALLTDGVIAGVGGVLVFIPVLLSLYLALAVLEDSGYMARAAFVMDRVMRWMGLHGKSFLPMIVGFGCTVPAVYATRTLENERDRKLTGFLATFMSCGARLPVYIVFGAAFLGVTSGNLIFAMYVLGIAVALATGLAFKHTVYRGKAPAPFVMELPPYRVPRVRDVLRQMWERTKGFVIKAGTVILSVSIVLWLLMAMPLRGEGSFNDVAPEDSVFGAFAGTLAPALEPAGFGTWQSAGALITGFLAKEAVVGTMNVIYVGTVETPDVDEGGADDTTFPQEVGASMLSFARASVLTIQEVVNIVPRTINLLPLVDVGELDLWAGSEADEPSTSSLQGALRASFTASGGSAQLGILAAVAFNVFVLLYVPCMAAVSAMRHEFGARWMGLQVAYTLVLAWLAAVLVFQVGRLVIGS